MAAYPDLKGSDRVEELCGKCGGTGRLTWTSVDGGRCWTCKGQGTYSVLVSSIRAREARRIRNQAARQAKEALLRESLSDARSTALTQLIETYPPFADALNPEGHAADPMWAYVIEEIIINVRNGVPAEEMIAHYRWRKGEVMEHLTQNRFRGKCHTCGEVVQPQAGWVGEGFSSFYNCSWLTFCPQHKPAAQ
jgi:hypothetical protein